MASARKTAAMEYISEASASPKLSICCPTVIMSRLTTVYIDNVVPRVSEVARSFSLLSMIIYIPATAAPWARRSSSQLTNTGNTGNASATVI